MPPDHLAAHVRAHAADDLRAIALAEFATAGFAATSLQHIAELAGYSKSSVLYHYASKEALLEAAVAPAVVAFETLLDECLAAEHRGVAPDVVERLVDVMLAHRSAVHVFLIQGTALRDIPIIARADAAVRRFAEALTTGDLSLDDQARIGIALGGTAYLLTAAQDFAPPAAPGDERDLREALVRVLGGLLAHGGIGGRTG